MKNTLSNQEIDELGEGLYLNYIKTDPSNSLCVDVEGLARYLGMSIEYARFAEKDKDKLGFFSNGIDPLTVLESGKLTPVVYPPKTIVLDAFLLNAEESGRRRFTIAHEIGHYFLERMNPGETAARYRQEFDSEKQYSKNELQRLFSIHEVMADRLAAAILMPKANVKKAIHKYADGRNFTIYGTSIMLPEDKIRMQMVANGIGVSFTALKIKLDQLGYIDKKSIDDLIQSDLRDGDFSDEDIEYDRSKGQLSPEQAYLIHRSRREAERLNQRIVKCPVCGFRMTTVTDNTSGITHLKCQKCRLQGPLNLSYFRTNRYKIVDSGVFRVSSIKTNNQT